MSLLMNLFCDITSYKLLHKCWLFKNAQRFKLDSLWFIPSICFVFKNTRLNTFGEKFTLGHEEMQIINIQTQDPETNYVLTGNDKIDEKWG